MSIDALRRFRRRYKRETPMSLIVGSEPTHEAAMLHAERAEMGSKLQTALSRLGKTFRTVIVLRDFEGLSYAEIAAALQIDMGTVASRLNRARLKLKKELQVLGIDENYFKS